MNFFVIFVFFCVDSNGRTLIFQAVQPRSKWYTEGHKGHEGVSVPIPAIRLKKTS